MIKKIIKRNGSIEDLLPSKINMWGEWASKNLGDKVDWSSVVLETVASLPETVSSQTLQERLIKTCLDYDTWAYYRMAGKLYAAYLHKNIHGDTIPSIKQVQQSLLNAGLMRALNYSDSDYDFFESVINHELDFDSAHFELHHTREKYALKNRVTGNEYETQQFVYMRMAMALGEDQPLERRRNDVVKWYKYFSEKKLNAPTPNYVNLGTPLRGFASCCVYTTKDTAPSLAVGDHIAYMMTVMSAGIGNNINTRSVGDPVRGGAIKHQGRLPYYKSLGGAVKANLQNGRGGAATTYYSAFDPEVETIARLKNPMSTEDKKNRDLDYGLINSRFFARKAAKRENIFTFNCFTAPDLCQALYCKDEDLFEKLYSQYEADPMFKKNYVSAREIVLLALNEANETGRHYLWQADEANRHTPFKDPIYSSNLCNEIALATAGYENMEDLYSFEDHGRGEIGLCSLAAAVISNIVDDTEYEDVMYYALLMIDKCIHQSEYVFPHLELTATSRLSAGVGIMGYAHYLAKKGLAYTSQEAKVESHKVAERHMYMAIKASLKLGIELGNAPWMHKTLWPDGWMPIDTYNRNVDNVVTPEYKYDWEELRSQVKANGGIRNSVLIAYMPGESSSKASGTTNSIYPVRDLTLVKTDNNATIYWAAPEGDDELVRYEFAWDIPTKDLIDHYAIFQKFTDQGISADFYRKLIGNASVTTTELLNEYFYLVKMGLKGRYYQNSLTSKGVELNTASTSCGSGGCTL